MSAKILPFKIKNLFRVGEFVSLIGFSSLPFKIISIKDNKYFLATSESLELYFIPAVENETFVLCGFDKKHVKYFSLSVEVVRLKSDYKTRVKSFFNYVYNRCIFMF